jgi:hypothetical protein
VVLDRRAALGALACAFANWTVFIDVKNIKPE